MAWLVLMAIVPNAFSQEVTFYFEHEKQDFSIVRERSSGEWIATRSCYGYARFYKMTAAGTSAQVLELDYLVDISDMILQGNSIYFCGHLRGIPPMQNRGIVGRFNINQAFANGNIDYIVVDSVQCLNKIAVFSVSQTTHVAMTGTLHDGTSCVADLVKDTMVFPGWRFHWGRVSDDATYKYDDIAVTDSYVVISASHQSTTGRLCFFEKPGMRGIPYFGYDDPTVVQLAGAAYSPILLESCLLDTAYAVCSSTQGINVYKYAGTVLQNQRRIHTFSLPNFTSRKLVDIRKTKTSTGINILTEWYRHLPLHSVGSEIWHITPSLMSSGGTVYAHTYGNHLLKSLDYRSSQPNGIVASGCLQSSTLHLYTLTSTAWGNCTNSNSANFVLNPNPGIIDNLTFERNFCDVNQQIMTCGRGTTPKVIICQ